MQSLLGVPIPDRLSYSMGGRWGKMLGLTRQAEFKTATEGSGSIEGGLVILLYGSRKLRRPAEMEPLGRPIIYECVIAS